MRVRRLDEGFGEIQRGEKTLDLVPQRILSGTLLCENRLALLGRHARQCQEDRTGAVARRGLHTEFPGGAASVRSTSCSQVRAKTHSFFTVAGDSSMAAAVSSMVSPAK